MARGKVKYYVGDLETNNHVDNCHAWACGLLEIGKDNINDMYLSNNLDDYFNTIEHLGKSKIYVHNLKFDGEFFISWLLNHGFTHIEKKEDRAFKTFSTLISDTGQFYSIDITFDIVGTKKNPERVYTTLIDSQKILPFSVAVIAKSFGCELLKGSIDYNLYREKGYNATEKERRYIFGDLYIVAHALQSLFDEGLNRITQGSNALNDCINELGGKKEFKRVFPPPLVENDTDIRKAYRGGWTYLKKGCANKTYKEGVVYDVNSMYPAVMLNEVLPYGDGLFFNGKYVYSKFYPLYIQKILVEFELKPGYLPTIQDKNNRFRFKENEYIENTQGEPLTLYMTNIDINLMFEHYNIISIEYINGWKFKGSVGVLKPYLDKWFSRKVQAEETKNKGLRTLSKLMLNAVYGKYASQPKGKSKIPFLSDDGIVKYTTSEEEERKTIYVMFAIFVTSYARDFIIRSAQKNYDRFIYADTDSLHLMGLEPVNIEVDAYKLGAWKKEVEFVRAKYIRSKTYLEEVETTEKDKGEYLEENPDHTNLFREKDGKIFKLNVTCCGLPARCYSQVTFKNFKKGVVYFNKLRPKRVVGGVVLENSEFSIKM